MSARSPSSSEVLTAISEGRLRVAGTLIETKGPWPKSVWSARTWEAVHPPKRPERPYYRVSFTSSEGSFRCLVHRLIWFAAGREIPEGFEINHIDGDKKNCALDNLELTTPGQNQRHALDLGLKVPARGRKMATRNKLSEDEVRWARKEAADGTSQADLARQLGVHQSHISKLCSRKIYGWVE